MVSFGACFDGYHLTLPGEWDRDGDLQPNMPVCLLMTTGNIIANPGFIEVFGKEFGGVLALDALHVSAWGGTLTAGSFAGNVLGGL